MRSRASAEHRRDKFPRLSVDPRRALLFLSRPRAHFAYRPERACSACLAVPGSYHLPDATRPPLMGWDSVFKFSGEPVSVVSRSAARGGGGSRSRGACDEDGQDHKILTRDPPMRPVCPAVEWCEEVSSWVRWMDLLDFSKVEFMRLTGIGVDSWWKLSSSREHVWYLAFWKMIFASQVVGLHIVQVFYLPRTMQQERTRRPVSVYHCRFKKKKKD